MAIADKNQKTQLKGRRFAALAADGFEKVELSVPVNALRAVGAHVDIISLRKGRIRGVNLHEPAGKMHVSKTVFEANPADYDGLILPGGLINPDLLRQSKEAREFVQAFDKEKKPIATLCHGPWVLISAGLVNGRTLASWPGIRDDVVNAGGTWLDQEMVRDGNWVSSRGPQDLKAFVKGMIELFSEGPRITQTPMKSGRSSPQRTEPPQTILSVMRWLPRPSVRTAIGLGSVALLENRFHFLRNAGRRLHIRPSSFKTFATAGRAATRAR